MGDEIATLTMHDGLDVRFVLNDDDEITAVVSGPDMAEIVELRPIMIEELEAVVRVARREREDRRRAYSGA